MSTLGLINQLLIQNQEVTPKMVIQLIGTTVKILYIFGIESYFTLKIGTTGFFSHQFSKQVRIAAQHVVITTSLGALKASELCFDPPLPESKQMAIQRLGFGTVDKVRGFDVGNKWFLDSSNTS
jgi:hypothetical protein